MDITFVAGVLGNGSILAVIVFILWGALASDRRRRFVLLVGAAILGAAILARAAWVILQPGFTFWEN